MLNEFKHSDHHTWDDSKIARCCPDNPPPATQNPPSPDCCYDTWESELTNVNRQLKDVTNELTHVQKHLAIATTRYTRLKQWHDELTTANELTFKICRQLEVIEAQLANICRNTCYTVKAVEILYCMIREFYYVLDELQGKYDSLMNCIKCMGNTLPLTSPIGTVLTAYGTALTTVVQTRNTLIPLLMSAVDSSIELEWQICDNYGYKKLIVHWQETLHCGIPCGEAEPASVRRTPLPSTVPNANTLEEESEEAFCLEPILHFPICNDPYYREIGELYEIEKEEVRNLTQESNELTKMQLKLTAAQQSLTKALKEVTPS